MPTQEAIQKLVAARLAADVTGVPTLLVARTDADAADLITSDCDPYDSEFITGERTSEGFFRTHAGIEQAISRGRRMRHMLTGMCETSTPDLELARRFAQAIHAKYPANCWFITARRRSTGRKPRRQNYCQLPAAAVGYGLQVPVHHPAGIHSMWFNMFDRQTPMPVARV